MKWKSSVSHAEPPRLLTWSLMEPYGHTAHQRELCWWKGIGVEIRGHVSRESSNRQALDSDPNTQPHLKKKTTTMKRSEREREREVDRGGGWGREGEKRAQRKLGKGRKREATELRKAPLCGLLLSPFTATEAILNASEKKKKDSLTDCCWDHNPNDGRTYYWLIKNPASYLNTVPFTVSPLSLCGCSYQKASVTRHKLVHNYN